ATSVSSASSRSRILRSKVHCRKQQRRFTAFRNRAANITRVGRVLNNHMVRGQPPTRPASKRKLRPTALRKVRGLFFARVSDGGLVQSGLVSASPSRIVVVADATARRDEGGPRS